MPCPHPLGLQGQDTADLSFSGLFGRKAAAAVAESTMPPVIQPGLALFTGQRAASGKGYKGSGGAGAAVPNGKGDSFGPDFAELNLFNVQLKRILRACAFSLFRQSWTIKKQCLFVSFLACSLFVLTVTLGTPR